MAMPAMPASGLVVVKAEFGFGGLEGVFDRPAPPFNLNQHRHRRSLRTPCREERPLAVAQAAPDQQAACPHRRRGATVEEASRIEIGQLQIVVKAGSLGPGAGGQLTPAHGRQGCRDLLGRAGYQLRLVPGVELCRARDTVPSSLAPKCAKTTK